jgi:atypical dual specificity phosphatase
MTLALVQELTARMRSDAAFRQQLVAAPRATLAGYDLTEEERLALILPNFGWLVPGELAGSARPLSDDALAALTAQGVRAVVSLTEEPLPDAALRAADLDAVHLPIADFTAPTQAQIAAAVAAIDRFVTSGRPVAVHCAAGLGRTGTILACTLVSRGCAAPAAIAAVRAVRPGSIETPAQEAAVVEWEAGVRGP